MIVKDSTARDSREANDDLITELGKSNRFGFERSVKNQFEFAKHYPIVLTTQDLQSPANVNIVGIDDISAKEATPLLTKMNFLSKANQTYRSTEHCKYSGKTQRWEGYVTDIQKDHFMAKLDDLTNGGTSELIKLDMADVSPEDKALLMIGATFYFSIGYVLNNGQRERTSLLRFKRIAEWTEEEFNRATDRGKQLYENLKWD
ncbi:MAG TPA: hypothetical protein VIM75_08270 [Ohtaekwangia sp.]|uniref:hypothetical protein n=1 Tax=Ohtaekwangia sp. TaxID=2066019 RepID=UPI002F94D85E